MSQIAIRTALETAVNGMAALATGWENKTFKPPGPTVPYQTVVIKFARPENIEQGAGYNEIGYMQVSLFYPFNQGAAAAQTRAKLVRDLFKKKSSFTSGGVTVTIHMTPEISGGVQDGDRWMVVVKVPFMAQIFGISPFDPSSLGGLVAWHRLGTGQVTDSAGGIAAWLDQSGNGNHLLQGTLGLRPTRQSDGSVKFDGVDDFLKTAAFTFAQPETVYLLLKQNSFTSIDYIFDGFVTNNGGVRQSGSSPNIALSVANTDYIFNAALAVGTYSVLCAIINGAGSLLRVNNTSVTGNVLVGNNMGGYTLGAVGSGAPRQSDIQVKESLLYNTAHDAATQQKVIDYLTSL